MREHMSSANTNSEIVQCMQSGQLLPIEALAPILRAQIEYEREGSRVLLIDGFPRRLDQAEPVEALVCLFSAFDLLLLMYHRLVVQ